MVLTEQDQGFCLLCIECVPFLFPTNSLLFLLYQQHFSLVLHAFASLGLPQLRYHNLNLKVYQSLGF